MRIFHRFEDFPLDAQNVVLTIGNFDGMHLGHQAIVKRVKSLALSNHGTAAVISFDNHPSQVLSPKTPVKSLCTLQHKLSLLEKFGVDILLLLTFNKNLSSQNAETFLQDLKKTIPFIYLILGNDAVFGKKREGTPKKIHLLSKKLNFQVEYLEKRSFDNSNISSTLIRQYIRKGSLKTAEKFLGRKYSIKSTIIKGQGKGKSIGFPTANIDLSNLCLPPLGVYAIYLLHKGTFMPGIANLGLAPTLKNTTLPTLEIHLFNKKINLYQCEVEVFLESFIREEKKFDSIEDLKTQITKDISIAQQLLILDD